MYSTLPSGCNVVRIWSHRGHLDSSDPANHEWTCDHVLMELQANGIHHFDVDTLLFNGELLVAHPTEMAGNLEQFSPSPCSKLSLKTFILKLKSNFGRDGFFVTIEPKAAWTEEEGDFLAPPEDVVSGILDVLEEETIPYRHCGIILQSWQLRDGRISPLEYRITQHCQISVPLKQSDTPLREDNFPPDNIKLVMPWVGLFGGNADGDWFLRKLERQGIAVILWIVDTLPSLHQALRLRSSVKGVISNNPVRLKHMYEEICQRPYAVRRDVYR